ncbi:MAG: hypothetical protein R3A78_12845 [Polyangiales bacterium]|nr:hypothetical protein [Myxococcales bacterium]
MAPQNRTAFLAAVALLVGVLSGCVDGAVTAGTNGASDPALSDHGKEDSPVSLAVNYAVIDAPAGGVPVRDIPSTDGAVVGVVTEENGGLVGTGDSTTEGDTLWIEVKGERNGWIDATNLTEWVDPDTFCNDERAYGVFEAFSSAMTSSLPDEFQSVVSPRHGLWLVLTPDGTDGHEVHLDNVGSWDALLETNFDWGTNPQNGAAVSGTFAELGLPELTDVLLDGGDLRCNRFPQGAGNFLVGIPHGLENLNFFTVSTRYDGAWLSWLVGFDVVGHAPYVTYVARLGRDDF